MTLAFWDRHGPLERLESRAGIDGRVVLTGPRGIGKSALAARWGERRASEGKGGVLLLPPVPPGTHAAAVETHLARAAAPRGAVQDAGAGWPAIVAGRLEARAVGAVVVDGLESYRHCLGPDGFAAFVSVLESLPGPVVATGVPAAAVPLSPSPWQELPLPPLDDDVVGEVLDRLWRARGSTLGGPVREILVHLIGGSPLALTAWTRAAADLPSPDGIDRPALLSLHAGLLGDGMIGRWWGRWWESILPDPAARRAAASAAASILSGAATGPVDPSLALPLETAGIISPTPTGHAPVADPQALRVLRLAALRDSGRPGAEVSFLEGELREWDRVRGYAEPLRIAGAVGDLLRGWGGMTVAAAVVGAEEPLPALPRMAVIDGDPGAAPGDLPFLIFAAVADEGPIGGRWSVAVATGQAPLAAAEVAALADALQFRRRLWGTAAERLLIVSPAGFTGGARTEALRAGAWHVDLAGLNELRAGCGLPPVPQRAGRPSRLPLAGVEGQAVELSLPPAADAELVAAAAADSLAQMAGFGKEDRDRVRMAVVEGVINALEHGGGRVHLRMDVTPDGLAVTVRDFGPGIPAGAAGPGAGEAGQRRGWGTAVMRQLMDEVRVEPVAEGAKLVLVKRRPAGRA